MSTTPHTPRRVLDHVLDVLFNVVVIVAVVAIVRSFLVSPFQVEGNSMVDTLAHNQYIIIDKFTYLFRREPQRGDVVVFHPPGDPKRYYVKRIIGLPAEEVKIRDGQVYVSSPEAGKQVLLKEDYLNARNQGHTFRAPVGGGDRADARYEVPAVHYFLMGDNRQGSLDSRSFRDEEGNFSPFIPQENIAGRVWFVALPVTKIHALEAPAYE